jgi:hypothetical protein
MSIQQALVGGSGGTSSTIGAGYPAAGTAAGAKDNSGNLAALNLDASGNLKTVLAAGGTLGSPLRTDPTGTTPQPVTGSLSLTDGSQIANTLAGDTGQSSLVVAGARKEVSFSTSIVQSVAVTDISNYRWVSVHVVTQGTSSFCNFEVSNDNLNWVSCTLSSLAFAAALTGGTSSANTILHGAISARYFRIRVSGISAGTTAGVCEFFTLPGAFGSTQGAVNGPTNSGSAVSSAPLLTAGSDGTNVRTLRTDTSGTLQASLGPTTTGGLSTTKLLSAASTNATSVKNSAGQLYNVQAYNLNAAARYLKLYNKASAPTVGTDTPVNVWLIPGGSSAGLVFEIANGLPCALGIAIALTTGIADSDTGAVAASEVLVNLQYK